MKCLSRKITSNAKMITDALDWLQKKYPAKGTLIYLLIGMIYKKKMFF